jgi:hypothetical protein
MRSESGKSGTEFRVSYNTGSSTTYVIKEQKGEFQLFLASRGIAKNLFK